MVRKYDRSSKRTTLINDDVRVYKEVLGEKAYWLILLKNFSTRYGY
jgi:hypothetical protein